jgi:serine/threonine protein kinase/Flp pilus assembly protein TadD
MDPQFHRAKSIFLAAIEKRPPEHRAAFLDSACGGDAHLYARVQELLNAHGDLGTFPEGTVEIATIDEPITECAGTVVGPYKLLEQIGEGGFGVVFMAEQERPVRRKVALKVLKPGMDTRQVIARFEAERQALALMDHPNIAQVFDGGETVSGRPYFVMELVKGIPINDFCDQSQLTPRERLELFVPVCQAVQHAHQKGIIHRDLKPSNVLVTLHDGVPVVKVIDFGIAKATGQQLTEKTLFTNFAQLVGTPLYMSPEQAALSGLDVDTRSDIYSLGVLLYELLTGTTPFDKARFEEVGYDEMRRIIREEEPPKPSTRISTLGQAATTVSTHRKSDPRRLSHLFRGELDWIVMKCLEKDRNRRYETANALARDIERYLQDEAVLACPPSATYRFGKFARRNKAALVATTVVLAALVAGVVMLGISTVLTRRAYQAERNERDEADRNFRIARQAVEDYFTQVSENQLLDAPGLEPLRKQLLETALHYYQQFIEQHADDPQLQADVAAAHLRVAQITYWNGGENDLWFPHLRDGANMIEQLLEDHRDTPEVARRLAGVYKGGWAPTRGAGGSVKPMQVVTSLQKVLHCVEKLVHDHPDIPDLQNDLAGEYLYLGDTYGGQEGLGCADKAVVLLEKLVHENADAPNYRVDLARAQEFRGKFLTQLGRSEEAEKANDKALLIRRELAAGSNDKASYRAWLAVSYRTVGELQTARNQPELAKKNLDQAVKLQQRLVEEFQSVHTYQIDLARSQVDLGDVSRILKRPPDAEKSFRAALAILQPLVEKFPGNDVVQQLHLQAAKDLAYLLVATGRSPEAGMVIREAVDLYRKQVQSPASSAFDRNTNASVFETLAAFLKDTGQPDEAVRCYRQALELRAQLAVESPDANQYQIQVLQTVKTLAQFRQAEAETAYHRAIDLYEKIAAARPNDPSFKLEQARRYVELGAWRMNSGQSQKADAAFRSAMVVFDSAVTLAEKRPTFVTDDRPLRMEFAYAAKDFGYLLSNSHRWTEAGKAFKCAAGLLQKLVAESPTDLKCRMNLADAYRMAGHMHSAPAERERFFRESLNVYEQLAAESATDVHRRWVAHSRLYLAIALADLNRPREGEESVRKAWESLATLPADMLADPFVREDGETAISCLANVLTTAGRTQEGVQLLRQAVALYEKLLATSPNDAGFKRELARRYVELGDLLRKTGNNKDAEAAYLKFRDAAGVLAQTSDHAWVARAYEKVGDLDSNAGRISDAIEARRSAVAAWEKLAAKTNDRGNRWRLGGAYEHLAELLNQQKNTNEAESNSRKAVAVWEKLAAETNERDHRWHLACANERLAGLLRQASHAEEASALYVKAGVVWEKLVREDPNNGDYCAHLQWNHSWLAELYVSERNRPKAEATFRDTIALFEKLAGEFPPGENLRKEAGHVLWHLGSLASAIGQPAEAEKYHRQALAVFEKLAADFPQNRFYRQEQGFSDLNIAELMQRQNRLSDAEKSLRDSVDVYSKLALEAPKETVYQDRCAVSHLNLAGLLVRAGRLKEAEQHCRKVLELHPKSALANNNLAWMLATSAETKLRDPARALVLAKKAVDLEPKQGMWWNTLGAAQHRAGDWKAAIAALKKSMELRNGGDSFDWFFLAMAHWQLGDKDEARKWYDKAVAWMDKNKREDVELKLFRAEALDLLGSKPTPLSNAKVASKRAK